MWLFKLEQSKVPWIPPNFDVHIRFPRALTPASRMAISKCTNSYLGSPGVKHLFLLCCIWMSMDLASLNLWLEIPPNIPWSISSSSICAKMWNAIRILFRWDTFWGMSGVESGASSFEKKTMEPCNSHLAKSRWAWSPGWKVKILASGAWLVTVICPKLFGKSLDPWCLQLTCKCKCPPRKPLQSRHCDRKDHERRWLRRLLTSLCDGQFCIASGIQFANLDMKKTPGPIIYAKTSPTQRISSHTLVEFNLGDLVSPLGTSFHDESPGRLGAWEAHLPSRASYLVFSLQCLGELSDLGVGCGAMRCYGFLPR